MPNSRFPRILFAAALFSATALTQAPVALALSGMAQSSSVGHQGIQPADTAPGSHTGTENQHSQATPPAADKPEAPKPDAAAAAEAEAEPAIKAEIIHDFSKLPEPVRKLREAIVEAAASGDVERMRPIMDPGAQKTDGPDQNEDPIETLKSFSGDTEGLEILAIMLDLMQTGVARIEAGTPDEVYVWPYFVGKPLNELTPPEKVDLLRIVTAGDLAAMDEAGGYNFYRIGISPDGKWKFIVSGD
ncbi:hypothetical protein [Neorhizobium sp. JUb45]|uniref:hypothetical protein n=1 Tax=unclassified Neorhizobium TaxID=2629175 RepID=UPI001043382A|nr:hypothetical protein [Neorhizobium sp. JUb45]TCR04392.1 hypothetical protein EDF70_102491 [Neorhizobium sp. JUb45]